MTFAQIQEIAGIPIDHSFLKYKRELTDYGYQVGKISMKEQTVIFKRDMSMTGLKRGTVMLVPHQEEWAQNAERTTQTYACLAVDMPLFVS